MSKSNRNNVFKRFIDMPVDSTPKTILVAVTLCLFCSMIVAFAAVNLRPFQEANKFLDKQKNILQVAGLYQDGISVTEAFQSFDPKIVDMKTGKFTNLFDPKTFDDRAASINSTLRVNSSLQSIVYVASTLFYITMQPLWWSRKSCRPLMSAPYTAPMHTYSEHAVFKKCKR